MSIPSETAFLMYKIATLKLWQAGHCTIIFAIAVQVITIITKYVEKLPGFKQNYYCHSYIVSKQDILYTHSDYPNWR